MTAQLAPEIRRRGLFPAVVYTASVGLKGVFTVPKVQIPGTRAVDLQWSDALLVTMASDLRGCRYGGRRGFA
jgi:inner membrane protein